MQQGAGRDRDGVLESECKCLMSTLGSNWGDDPEDSGYEEGVRFGLVDRVDGVLVEG